ncbi:MAG TPA: gamma-glutamyltransferase family protein [Longimicrobiales bacterium]|nr:gamma-glutamyltransferase family protein [Longimicrobiales bacterium]
MPVARTVPTLLLLLAAVSGCSSAARTRPGPTPPPDEGKRVVAQHGVVSSANALASEAGLEILRAGGNAVDAAVATAFAIGVVEPQMSGLGGSGAALVWVQREGKPYYLDFYAAQNAESFRGHTASGRLQPGDLRIVGIPGDVAGLLTLLERFGTLPRERVMAPAIRLAEQGFPIGDILAGFIRGDSAKLARFPASFARYWPNGRPLPAGTVLRNPELATSLRRVAEHGKAGFYEGETARQVVATLNAGGHPATLADLAGFQPQWKRPLCTDYHGRVVLSAPPPQTGLQVLHTLELLEPIDLPRLGLPTRSAAAFDALVSALRVGMADAHGNSDPNWVPVPAAGIASAGYAQARRSLVARSTAVDSIAPGDARPFDRAAPAAACGRYEPYGAAQAVSVGTGLGAADGLRVRGSASRGAGRGARVGDTGPESRGLLTGPEPRVAGTGPGSRVAGMGGGTRTGTGTGMDADRADREMAPGRGGETTHISVVDRDGNAVSLTQTNSTTFGSGAFVAGFHLNDSGFVFTDAALAAPSRSHWRIRTTTISPTIVLDGGRVHMVVGAPGGGRIPTEIAQTMVYTLDYGMDPLEAVRMPRIYPDPDQPRVELEHGFTPELLREARAMGYEPTPPTPGYARLYMIVRRGGEWIGVADPRHDGQARGY